MRGSFRAAGLIEPDESEYEAPVIPAGKFGTIVVDPPWDMQKIEREVRPNQIGFDYPTMTEKQLAEWPIVADLSAASCHLFCWTTQRFLPAAIEIVEAWDFRYCITMVWHKPGGFQPMGLPQYNCEFVVYARRGSPSFIETTDFPCCFVAPRREHSRKPEQFYDLIRRVTSGPRVDVFSREARDGFAQYGNETAKFS
jgi:N6-adenosine-specific RNA methylase IME4